MGAHAFNPSTLEAKFSEILNKKKEKKEKVRHGDTACVHKYTCRQNT